MIKVMTPMMYGDISATSLRRCCLMTLQRIARRSWLDIGAVIAAPAGCVGLLLEGYFRTEVGDAESSKACSYPPIERIIQEARVNAG